MSFYFKNDEEQFQKKTFDKEDSLVISLLRKLDFYAFTLNMNVHGSGAPAMPNQDYSQQKSLKLARGRTGTAIDPVQNVNTSLGGLISITFTFLCILYGIQQFKNMVEYEATEFTVSDLVVSPADAPKINLGVYNETFNFIVGTTDDTIDQFDNPYFHIGIYYMEKDWALHYKEYLYLEICPIETKLQYMTEETAKFYKNALCIANRDNITIWGNWFENNFNTLVVVVEECMNTTHNNNKCAPVEEI